MDRAATSLAGGKAGALPLRRAGRLAARPRRHAQQDHRPHQGDRRHQPEQPDRRRLPARGAARRSPSSPASTSWSSWPTRSTTRSSTTTPCTRRSPSLAPDLFTPDLQRAVQGLPGRRLPVRLAGGHRPQAARAQLPRGPRPSSPTCGCAPTCPAQHAIQVALGGHQSINDLILPGGRLLRAARRRVGAAARDPRASAASSPRARCTCSRGSTRRSTRSTTTSGSSSTCCASRTCSSCRAPASTGRTPDHLRIVLLPRADDLEDAIGRLGEVPRRATAANSDRLRPVHVASAGQHHAGQPVRPADPLPRLRYWELDPVAGERARDCGGGAELEKEAWVSDTLLEWGSCGQFVYVDGVPAGYVLYAPAAYVPRAVAFPTSPVSADAVLLMTARMVPEFARRRSGPDARAGRRPRRRPPRSPRDRGVRPARAAAERRDEATRRRWLSAAGRLPARGGLQDGPSAPAHAAAAAGREDARRPGRRTSSTPWNGCSPRCRPPPSRPAKPHRPTLPRWVLLGRCCSDPARGEVATLPRGAVRRRSCPADRLPATGGRPRLTGYRRATPATRLPPGDSA